MVIFQRSIYFFIHHRWWFVALLTIAACLGALTVATSIKIDNAVSIWFLEENPDYQSYLQFQHERGSDEIIIAMLPVDDPLDDKWIGKLQKLHSELDTLSAVTTTFSLANAEYPIYSNRQLYFRPIYARGRTKESINRLLNDLPVIKQQLFTEDHIFFYVQLEPTDIIEKDRNVLVEKVCSKIEGHFSHAIISGQPILNEAFNDSVFRESSFFAVVTIIVIIGLLFLLLPAWQYLPLALAAVASPVGILMGLMTAMGYSLNMISMLIPTILLVYSVCDVVHIINIYHKYQLNHLNEPGNEKIVNALKLSLKPCFYTTLTTVVGYIALYVSPLPAFKIMGVFTFLGLVLSFAIVYIITAIGFSFITVSDREQRKLNFDVSPFALKVNHWTSKYNGAILLSSLLIIILGIIVIPQIEVSTDSLNLLREGKAKQDLQRIEDALGGNARFQLNIVSKDGSSLLNANNIASLEQFQDSLHKHPYLSTPISIVNFKRFLEKRSSTAYLFGRIRWDDLMSSDEEPANAFFSLNSDQFNELGIALNVRELETSTLEKIIEDIHHAFAITMDSQQLELEIHGFLALFAQLNTFILQTQFRSFGLAFMIAFVILIFFIQHLKTSIIALLPNLLPLFMTAILMAILGVKLEASNVMLAPIMLGVAMDDTIHLMNKYAYYRKQGFSVDQSIDQALVYTGGALFTTTIALVCGFMVVGLSGVISVSTFGLLCAFTVVAALWADVVVLPALIKRVLN
jgi:predicted RND superfamily exporter protein